MLGTLVNILLLVVVIWFFYQRLAPVKGVRNISTTELKSEIKNKDKQFIDVRTPNEFKANHIKEFKNIPLANLQIKANDLSVDKEVFVICQSGMRSVNATRVLKKMGFKHITNVKGGMSAWRH
ncbi:rhodanese-like domain-containing protein [Sporosarcina sp. Marseille-Q4063]|uniref:rhodanese-like domain-containing protein n=1 Tax=Sporosarcina sp. Marseille-Q4063 TaxID=2810514 RepID=UPI001BB0243A|nr:rhodanese-like domain-containing protein [Sporosarcina sp. Marseille-Q4063]QUW22930.1 rhodanese-like domain-containing protein [Sporosarcina sp. Marseille-Q4063]